MPPRSVAARPAAPREDDDHRIHRHRHRPGQRAGGNSTALVGTPDTVAQALLDYVDLGVTTPLIRGYDPLEDAVDYGRELIPLVRAEVARRDAAQAGAEAELAGRSWLQCP
jgi:alkanesulfonate monooxygenase SsuD/methylene tetrahydromethanopterin reductase-like flavin-dependent oxidoreductase (luciferase family)